MPFCTNNRHHDYSQNIYHLPTNQKSFSAKYLCSLYGGSIFSYDEKLIERSTIKKIVLFVGAWLLAIATVGIVPYFAKKNYLEPLPVWTPLWRHTSSEIPLDRGDLLKRRSDNQVYIVTSAISVSNFNYDKLTLKNESNRDKWDQDNAYRYGSNISYIYPAKQWDFQKAIW